MCTEGAFECLLTSIPQGHARDAPPWFFHLVSLFNMLLVPNSMELLLLSQAHENTDHACAQTGHPAVCTSRLNLSIFWSTMMADYFLKNLKSGGTDISSKP